MKTNSLAILVAGLLLMPVMARAQERQGGGPGWGFSAIDVIQELLGAPDAEWRVLQPKIQNIINLQQSLDQSRSGFAGPGWQGTQMQSNDPVTRAAVDLRSALQNGITSNEVIAAKVSALHAARETAQASLDAARKDLVGLLTARQEAILMILGYLE